MGKQDLQGTEITQEAAKELLEGSVRMAQYSIKENKDGFIQLYQQKNSVNR